MNPKAYLAVGFIALFNHASAAGLPVGVPHLAASTSQGLAVSLPAGYEQCQDSTPGAACPAGGSAATARPTPGIGSTPDGMTSCDAGGSIAFSGLGACTDAGLVLDGSAQDLSVQHLDLKAGAPFAEPGQKAVLTATATTTVTGTGKAIEIFDMTTRTVAAACAQGSQCIGAYSANAGLHNFAAFIMDPGSDPPAFGSAVNSTQVGVEWDAVTVTAKSTAVGPGKPLTVTAVSTAPERSGYFIQFFDADSKARLAYCKRGNTCSVALTDAGAGVHPIVAAVAKASPSLPASEPEAQSSPLALTWLSASITGAGAYQVGSSIYLNATSNADLTGTPWSLAIVDDKGQLVGKPCKTGSTCSAQVTATEAKPTYFAVIGTVSQAHTPGTLGEILQKVLGPTAVTDVQARSGPAKPPRLLWGVDSCKRMTDDRGATTGLYPAISSQLGRPDFWGRYLTDTVCPGITGTEAAAAHNKGIGILPIYNDYICSNVVGYDTAKGYATAAAAAARALGIPEGRGLAIDIEPPGEACPGAANIDSGFIHGWVDGMGDAHYVPIFYGNGTAGTEFATQWCVAVNAMPYIAQRSFLWSFQPSLLGDYNRGSAPAFAPNQTGCAGTMAAWQYQIGSSSSTPDVDGDEATSDLPLWYP